MTLLQGNTDWFRSDTLQMVCISFQSQDRLLKVTTQSQYEYRKMFISCWLANRLGARKGIIFHDVGESSCKQRIC